MARAIKASNKKLSKKLDIAKKVKFIEKTKNKKGQNIKNKKSPPKTLKKTEGRRRQISDIKLLQLQKMHKTQKYPIKMLCDKFDLKASTLFNYLNVKI